MSDYILEPFKDINLNDLKGDFFKKGWSPVDCDLAEREYIRFLALSRAYPDEVLAPCKAVDLFWHNHILDTKRYEADCNTYVGFFLHHIPPREDTQDARDRMRQAGDNTVNRYRRHFGEPGPIWTSERTCIQPGRQNNPPR